MPRTRQPSPTSNRTDLNRPAPVTTVTGQTYGDAAAQEASQRIQPMAGGATAPPSQTPGAPASSGPVPPQGAPGPQDIIAAMQAHAAAGGGPQGNFTRPTERPGEPVTHGLPVGPGAGPEALTGIGAAARSGAMQQASLNQLLSSMAAKPDAPSAVQNLASLAQGGTQ